MMSKRIAQSGIVVLNSLNIKKLIRFSNSHRCRDARAMYFMGIYSRLYLGVVGTLLTEEVHGVVSERYGKGG